MRLAMLSLVVGLVVLPSFAHAQSFDCGPYLRKGIIPESVICESPQLAALDSEMAGVYEQLIDQLPDRAARQLRNDQRRWLGARNSCGYNANCLVGLYRGRIDYLRNY